MQTYKNVLLLFMHISFVKYKLKIQNFMFRIPVIFQTIRFSLSKALKTEMHHSVQIKAD